MHKVIIHGKLAREKLLNGINIVADTVKITSGPRGKNVIIGSKNQLLPMIINDGVTIAKEIFLEDPIENIGAALIKEASISTNEIAGDGTTTATILTQGIVNAAIELVDNGYSPVLLKDGIMQGMKKVYNALKSQKIEIVNNKQIIAIASLASNSIEAGKIISRAVDLVGKYGIIKIEDSQTCNSYLEHAQGFEMKGGFLSPFMVNNKEKNLAEHQQIKILLLRQPLNDLSPLIKLLEKARYEKTAILIIAPNFSEEVISALAINNVKKIVQVIAVKPINYYQQALNCLWTDLEVVTKTTAIIDKELTTENLPSWEELGQIEKLIMTNTKSTFIYNQDKHLKLQEHIDELKKQSLNLQSSSDDYDQLKTRIAQLTNSAAIIKIAGLTELEQKENKFRMEDALHASRFAIDEGIIPGGGLAFINCMKSLSDFHFPDPEINAGWRLVYNSLALPLKQIVINSGENPQDIFMSIWNNPDNNIGFDALKKKMVNVFENGLIDPFKVCSTALEKACSVAASIITTEAVVAYPNKNQNFLNELAGK